MTTLIKNLQELVQRTIQFGHITLIEGIGISSQDDLPRQLHKSRKACHNRLYLWDTKGNTGSTRVEALRVEPHAQLFLFKRP